MTNGSKALAAAKRVAPVFSGSRLAAIRELTGLTQAETASAAEVTPSALSQAERGRTRLSAANIARLAKVLRVTPDAFVARPEPEWGLPPQFRHLRRTPALERRKAEQFIRAVARIVWTLGEEVQLPEFLEFTRDVDPGTPIQETADDIEEIAGLTREALGIDAYEPIGHKIVRRLEKRGVVVVRDRDTHPAIDAFSAVVEDVPIIVVDGGPECVWDRDNFNLAHELGHLVMHRKVRGDPGTRTVEAQAHRFAAAFLGPADVLRDELPASLDWERYLELKRTWGLSMAALVKRSFDLGLINDNTYTRAMKQRSAYGWRTDEPGSDDRRPRRPRILLDAAAQADLTTKHIARRTHLPMPVVERIIGTGRPALVT